MNLDGTGLCNHLPQAFLRLLLPTILSLFATMAGLGTKRLNKELLKVSSFFSSAVVFCVLRAACHALCALRSMFYVLRSALCGSEELVLTCGRATCSFSVQITNGLPPGITLVSADNLEEWFLDIQVLDQNPIYAGQTYRLKFKFSDKYPIGRCTRIMIRWRRRCGRDLAERLTW